jgi:DNA repair protein RadD
MLDFERFISRFDEELVQQIIGRHAVQVLSAIDTKLTNIGSLQKSLLKIYSPIQLLETKSTRKQIFNLLKEEEARILCSLLGIVNVEDPYSILEALKFRDSDERRIVYNFFSLDGLDQENKNVVVYEKGTGSNYALFEHQRKAVYHIEDLLYKDSKRVMLHMPTGSGKTRTAMNVICDHLRRNEPSVVIWLAHSEELCEQAATEFEKAWYYLGNRILKTIRYWGESDADIDNLKDGFIVAGLSKLTNLLKRDAALISKLGSRGALVIMDEAHMSIAPTYELNISVLNSFGASLLGLSATPGRTWNDVNADQKLADFYNRRKVTLKVRGYDNPVDYLIEKGYLARVKNVSLFYQNGMTLSSDDLKYLQENFELSKSIIKKLSIDQMRNILIIDKIEELVTRHKRILVFALTVDHANLLALCLQARDVNAFSVTSKTDPSQRKKLLDSYRSKSQDTVVLCNYGILTTGFDAPETSAAMICRPTDSLVLYSQMVGRAMRGPLAGGNLTAEIVTVVDSNLPGFDSIQTAFFNWEDVW